MKSRLGLYLRALIRATRPFRPSPPSFTLKHLFLVLTFVAIVLAGCRSLWRDIRVRRTLNVAALSPGGEQFVLGGWSGGLTFGDAASGRARTPSAVRRIWSVAFAKDRTPLAVVRTLDAVQVWDVRAGRLLTTITPEPGYYFNHCDLAADTVVTAEANRGSRPPKVKLWNARTRALMRTWNADTNHLSLSPDGRWIVGDTWIRDAVGPVEAEPRIVGSRIVAAAFSPNGRTAVTADADGELRCLSIAPDGYWQRLFRGAVTNKLAYSSDGQGLVAWHDDDDALRYWDAPELGDDSPIALAAWPQRRELRLPGRKVLALAAASSTEVRAITTEGTILRWNPKTGETTSVHIEDRLPEKIAILAAAMLWMLALVRLLPVAPRPDNAPRDEWREYLEQPVSRFRQAVVPLIAMLFVLIGVACSMWPYGILSALAFPRGAFRSCDPSGATLLSCLLTLLTGVALGLWSHLLNGILLSRQPRAFGVLATHRVEGLPARFGWLNSLYSRMQSLQFLTLYWAAYSFEMSYLALAGADMCVQVLCYRRWKSVAAVARVGRIDKCG